MDEDETSEEDERGEVRPKLGAGWWGSGPPIQIFRKGKCKDLRDGLGLCSPGRWTPEKRRLPELEAISDMGLALQKELLAWEAEHLRPRGFDVKKLLMFASCQKLTSSPFPAERVIQSRGSFRSKLKVAGFEADRVEQDRKQAVEIRLVEAVLVAAKDPDVSIMRQCRKGVRLGARRKMPRTPAVYERKQKWKLKETDEDFTGKWASNYFEHSSKRTGWREMMVKLKLAEAVARYGDRLVIAALGAIEKARDSDAFRIIYDGARMVFLNPHVRPRDQQRLPSVGDLESLLRGGVVAQGASSLFLTSVGRIEGPPTDACGRGGLGTTGLSDPSRRRRGMVKYRRRVRGHFCVLLVRTGDRGSLQARPLYLGLLEYDSAPLVRRRWFANRRRKPVRETALGRFTWGFPSQGRRS